MDLNKTITPIFNVLKDEDGCLVARSDHPQFEDMDISLEEATAENLREKLEIWCRVHYEFIADIPAPDRIMVSEQQSTSPNTRQFKAFIQA